jgi:tRNA (guanine-N7-)-methyltransferase
MSSEGMSREGDRSAPRGAQPAPHCRLPDAGPQSKGAASDTSADTDFGVPIPGRVVPQAEWAKTAIKRLPPTGPLDWSAIFGRKAPIVLELGCGNGRFTLLSALARPELDHFAIDILPLVVRYATRRANQRGLSNVRFAVKDAETFMGKYVPAGSVSEVHLYHPQPFADRRLAHRRLVRPVFLADVHRALAPGGLFVLQTDNPEYWGYMRDVVPAFFAFQEQEGPWPDAPEGRTRREILARSRGLPIYRGLGRRLAELSEEEIRERLGSLPSPLFRTRGPSCELDAIEAEGVGRKGRGRCA